MSLYAEVELTPEEKAKQRQIEADALLAYELQQAENPNALNNPNAFGNNNNAIPQPRVQNNPIPVAQPPIQNNPIPAPQRKKRKPKEKEKEGEWTVAFVGKEEEEFAGWGFKKAPPAWK